MATWRYIKGSEEDFQGAPDWALYLAQTWSHGKVIEAWEGLGDRYCYTPESQGNNKPLYEFDDGGFINWPWRIKPIIIAQRERVISVNDDRLIQALITERGNRYGKFADGADIMQQLKDVMRKTDGWSRLTNSQREALEMIQHKIGRALNGDPTYDDNWKDIAGYATLVAEELNGVKK